MMNGPDPAGAQMLQRHVKLLPATSPLRPMVVAEVRRLDELLR